MQEKNKTVSTHKPLNLNCSVKTPKSLMCDSFNVQPTKEWIKIKKQIQD